jgi:hypothetical protein
MNPSAESLADSADTNSRCCVPTGRRQRLQTGAPLPGRSAYGFRCVPMLAERCGTFRKRAESFHRQNRSHFQTARIVSASVSFIYSQATRATYMVCRGANRADERFTAQWGLTTSPTCRRLAPDFALFPGGYRDSFLLTVVSHQKARSRPLRLSCCSRRHVGGTGS